jgi:hypothetical protein
MRDQKCSCLVSDPKTGKLVECGQPIYSSTHCYDCSVLCSVCRQEPAHPEINVCKKCADRVYPPKIEDKDLEELITLSKRLLTAANMLCEKENMIQPFFGIVLECTGIINKLDLFEEKKKSTSVGSTVPFVRSEYFRSGQ